MTSGGLLNLIWRTITAPRAALREVLDMNLPVNVIVQAAVAIAILSVLFPYVLVKSIPNLPEAQLLTALSPIGFFTTQLAGLGLIAGGLYYSGKIFGGSASFMACLTAATWMQAVQFTVQVVQMVVGLALPFAGGIIFMVSLILPFYLLVQFACELQGFKRPILVLLGVFVVANLVGVLIAVVLGSMGISMAELVQNV